MKKASRLTIEQEDEIIHRNAQGEGQSELARAFGVSRWVIGNVFDRLHTQPLKHSSKISGDICGLVVKAHLELKSADIIAGQFAISAATVRRILKDEGIKLHSGPSKRADTGFFERVDTEEKAWLLGFLAADGCNFEEGWAIALQGRDRAILETVSQMISIPSNPVKVRDYAMNGKPYSVLKVRSRKMAGDLTKLGITPRKSLTIEPWSGESRLMRHYWRGVIDGDGCIFKGKDKSVGTGTMRWSISLVGSRGVIEAFAEMAKSVCDTQASPKSKGNVWTFSVNGKTSARKLAAYLYEGATVALDRKKAMADELLASPQLRVTSVPRTDEGRIEVTCPDCQKKRSVSCLPSASRIITCVPCGRNQRKRPRVFCPSHGKATFDGLSRVDFVDSLEAADIAGVSSTGLSRRIRNGEICPIPHKVYREGASRKRLFLRKDAEFILQNKV